MAPINAIFKISLLLLQFIVRAGFFVSPVMWTYEMMLLNYGSMGEMVIVESNGYSNGMATWNSLI